MTTTTTRHAAARRFLFAALAPALALALQLGAARPAHAQNELSVRVSNSYLADKSVFAFSEDNLLLQAELSYARALFDAQRGLWVEASWTVGAKRADLFGYDLQARALIHSLTVGARYSRPLLPWLVPHARAGLGVIFGALTLEGDGTTRGFDSGAKTSDVAAGLTGYLLAGVQLLLPRRWMYTDERGITAGVVIEGGVTASTNLGFDLTPEQGDDLRTIPLTGSALGSLSVSGGVLRIGALLRF